MIDTVQVILISVIVLLAVLFTVLGVQVFFILRELRKTLFKTNKILDEVDALAENVSEPISFISGLLFSSKTLGIIKKFLKHDKKED